MRSGSGDLLARTVAIWVFIDRAGGRPSNLHDDFFEIYGDVGEESQGERHGCATRRPARSAEVRSWALRESDFDLLDHVNNARYLEAVEDELAVRFPKHRVVEAELEFRGTVERGDRVDLVTEVLDSAAVRPSRVWLVSERDVRMSAIVGTRVAGTLPQS